jgi:sensor histidine kinase YesM
MNLIQNHRSFIINEIKSFLLIAGISLVFAYINCPPCFTEWESALRSWFYNFLAWAFLWKGNEYLNRYLNLKISWVNQTLKRFIWGTVCMIIYTILILSFIQYFFFLIGIFGSKWAPLESYIFALSITIFITLLVHSIAFLKSWRQAELNMEKLKNEQLSSQYEALKNQVNPHFLFNSLNALTSLVYENQDQAAYFIQQLSKVYRYVLDNREKEMVLLETELNFVESYLFLQKIRYGDNLKYTIKAENRKLYKVAPLSVQMLIENAIKHNVISNEEPLEIIISIDEDGYLVTRNKLQVKNIINEYSGIGLENIKARYGFFSNRKIIVEKTHNEFIVKLPLVRADQDIISGKCACES